MAGVVSTGVGGSTVAGVVSTGVDGSTAAGSVGVVSVGGVSGTVVVSVVAGVPAGMVPVAGAAVSVVPALLSVVVVVAPSSCRRRGAAVCGCAGAGCAGACGGASTGGCSEMAAAVSAGMISQTRFCSTSGFSGALAVGTASTYGALPDGGSASAAPSFERTALLVPAGAIPATEGREAFGCATASAAAFSWLGA